MPDTKAALPDPKTLEIVKRLVAFDTTSRDSNLALIDWVREYLAKLGIDSHLVFDATGKKANLWATIGPADRPGLVLSGHTDVVPIDGQEWTVAPFEPAVKDGKLYGRGTTDMKSFVGVCLALAPHFQQAKLKTPIHFAFSYDEEVGCLGAPDMIAVIVKELPRPALVVVGEPTDMVAVSGHKGIASFKVTVNGHEAHSSLTHLGVSANMAAIKLMNALVELSETLEREADKTSRFMPPNPTLTVGLIHGGTAVNILARECVFVFDLRFFCCC